MKNITTLTAPIFTVTTNANVDNRKLYTFTWIGGGYNQVYAASKKEAIKEIAKEFPNDNPDRVTLLPDLATLKVCKNPDAYYRNMPLMD